MWKHIFQDLHTLSKVNTKYIHGTQWGKQDRVFTCPAAILYKFYMPRASIKGGALMFSKPNQFGKLRLERSTTSKT